MVNRTAVDMLSEASISNSTRSTTKCTRRVDTSAGFDDTTTGEMVWPKDVQGYVLGAFFWGYLSSQIIGGYLASRYGGRAVISFSIVGCIILTLISPLAAKTSVYAFVAVRVLMGVVQGPIFPAFHAMWSLWAPPLERSLLTGVTYAGAQIGNTAVMPLSGLLCKYGFAGGWPSIFYVIGIGGILWCIFWFIYASNAPSHSKHISKNELNYIESSLGDTKTSTGKKVSRPVPWLSILKSRPVWALFCGHFAADWSGHMMVTTLPLFMNDVLGLDFDSLGYLTAIPYIAYFICMNIGGFAADKLQNAKILSTIGVRRLAMIVSLGSQAIFLVASGYCGCGQDMLVTTFLTLGVGLSGIQYAGYMVNYLDIAPAFTGPILGIGNTIPAVGGIIGPMLVGQLTPTGSQEEWQLVFWITAGVLVTGTAIFCLFASDEVQPWALLDNAGTECELEQKTLNNSE
uniref:Major facilitator superfamily (MFS) profile domain-containing protein n=1 Tax=Setaria digitata TaxID=48799 RepID=A0A915PI03_9BILA